MARLLATVATVIVVRVAVDVYLTSDFRRKLITRNN